MKTTNVKQISRKSAANPPPIRILFVPYLQQSRDQVKYKFTKNESQKWIPLTCSLLFRPEFVALSPHSRYIYVGILLLCGTLGTDEISANTRYLSNALSADERTIKKAVEELLFC